MNKTSDTECKYKNIGYMKFEKFIEAMGGKWSEIHTI